MFWSKTDREARRQKVLDELIEIEPVDRPSRLQEAVTAGDVRASEVDQALRLVDRLDALRVMSIPHVDGGFRGAAHGTDTETVVGRAEAPVVAADVESAPRPGLVDLDEPATWDVVIKAVALVNRIVDDVGRDALVPAVQGLFGPVFDRLGWGPVEGESSQARELRAKVIDVLGTFGRDAGIIVEATSRFDTGEVSGDLANAIVAITMHQSRPGDEEVYHYRYVVMPMRV